MFYKQAFKLFQGLEFLECVDQCASDDRCLYLTMSQAEKNCAVFTIGTDFYDFSAENLYTVRYRARQVGSKACVID